MLFTLPFHQIVISAHLTVVYYFYFIFKQNHSLNENYHIFNKVLQSCGPKSLNNTENLSTFRGGRGLCPLIPLPGLFIGLGPFSEFLPPNTKTRICPCFYSFFLYPSKPVVWELAYIVLLLSSFIIPSCSHCGVGGGGGGFKKILKNAKGKPPRF